MFKFEVESGLKIIYKGVFKSFVALYVQSIILLKTA